MGRYHGGQEPLREQTTLPINHNTKWATKTMERFNFRCVYFSTATRQPLLISDFTLVKFDRWWTVEIGTRSRDRQTGKSFTNVKYWHETATVNSLILRSRIELALQAGETIKQIFPNRRPSLAFIVCKRLLDCLASILVIIHTVVTCRKHALLNE